MSGVFTTQLRANRPPVLIGGAAGGPAVTFRVESSDLWDAVRVVARQETPISEVKQGALANFYPDGAHAVEFVLKFRGWEILDEGAPLRDVGIGDGSILLLAIRRRRPVR